MRQEAVNTFNGGLVYDLNPLVTPNSVLTDAVNGTFITFNGNELSLQNDAGNTVINVKNIDEIQVYNGAGAYLVGDKVSTTDSTNKIRCWVCVVNAAAGESPTTTPGKWQEYIVRLSPGFYPLAVKEYGGVLYIVSARNLIRMATYFDNTKTYAKDEVVRAGLDYLEEGVSGHYYISLKYNNTDDILIPESWEYIGPTEEAIKRNEVEFGSYPSPEGSSEDDGNEESKVFNSDDLYITKVLNTKVFSSDSSVSFDSDLEILDYISRTGEDPRFYNVKLIHQLSSGGERDLTTFINAAYANFTPKASQHWLFEPTFRFYNPAAYKGKLAIRIEITDLKSFTSTSGLVTYDPITNTYQISFTVSASFYTNAYTIGVSGFTISLSRDIGTIAYGAPNIVGGDILQTITIEDIPSTEVGNFVNYSIAPIFTWAGSPQSSEDLPLVYVTKYTINGVVTILDQSYNINLSFNKAIKNAYGANLCSLAPEYKGYRMMHSWPITNAQDEYVDMEFKVTSIPHVLQFYDIPNSNPNVEVIGIFNWDVDYKISSITWEPAYAGSQYAVSKLIIEQSAIGTECAILDITCQTSELIINVVGEEECTIVVQQPEVSISKSVVGNTITVEVQNVLPVNITITPKTSAYKPIIQTINITENTTYDYILVSNLSTYLSGLSKAIIWNSTTNISGITAINMDVIYTDPINPTQLVVFQGELKIITNLGFMDPAYVLCNSGTQTPKLFDTDIQWYTFTTDGPEANLSKYKNTQSSSSDDYVIYGNEDEGIVCFEKQGNPFNILL